MTSDKPFNYTLGYHYGSSWAAAFWAKHTPNSENGSCEDCEADNCFKIETNSFCWPCVGCKVSCRFFSFSPISNRTEWRHINTAWLPSTSIVSNGGLRRRILGSFWDEFLQDSRHFRGWKAERLLAIDEDKKVSFLEWPFSLTSREINENGNNFWRKGRC